MVEATQEQNVLNRAHVFHFGQPGPMPSTDMNFYLRVFLRFGEGQLRSFSTFSQMKTIVIWFHIGVQYNKKYTPRKLMCCVPLTLLRYPFQFSKLSIGYSLVVSVCVCVWLADIEQSFSICDFLHSIVSHTFR